MFPYRYAERKTYLATEQNRKYDHHLNVFTHYIELLFINSMNYPVLYMLYRTFTDRKLEHELKAESIV